MTRAQKILYAAIGITFGAMVLVMAVEFLLFMISIWYNAYEADSLQSLLVFTL